MAEMPTTVKVGPHVYKVIRQPKSKMTDHGGCDYNTLTISIQQRIRKSKAREVLLHEVLHTCTYPTLNDQTLLDEKFVDGIAPTLLQVMQDNPQLLEYLTQ